MSPADQLHTTAHRRLSDSTRSGKPAPQGGYADDTDYSIELTDLAAGTHHLYAIDVYGDTWQGGWAQICVGRCDTGGAVVVAGGEDVWLVSTRNLLWVLIFFCHPSFSADSGKLLL